MRRPDVFKPRCNVALKPCCNGRDETRLQRRISQLCVFFGLTVRCAAGWGGGAGLKLTASQGAVGAAVFQICDRTLLPLNETRSCSYCSRTPDRLLMPFQVSAAPLVHPAPVEHTFATK